MYFTGKDTPPDDFSKFSPHIAGFRHIFLFLMLDFRESR